MFDEFKKIPGGITAPQGFKAAGVASGIKESGKKDLALIFSELPTTAAAVFTTNRIPSASILVSKNHLAEGRIHAVVINSGNANACTGELGLEHAIQMAKATANWLEILPQNVLVASTGIIGVTLPMEKIKGGIAAAIKVLARGGSQDAAQAIMTTDTFFKEMAIQFEVGGQIVKIGGIAKGSGMIAPNMATMLAFLTTDAHISDGCLTDCLRESVNRTFNMITVDGQQSTNDMVAILANGMAGNKEIIFGKKSTFIFQEALNFVCQELAKMIIKDGEGATKFIEITIKGAESVDDAKRIAQAIANSNLVKTAFFGEDANWGRIMAAIGSSGAEFEPSKINLFFGSEMIVANGEGLSYEEARVNQVLKSAEIKVTVDLNTGEAGATVWTTDLSYEYVRINAAYRT